MKRAGIDWERVHERLHAGERAREATLAWRTERTEAIYRQRAERLAWKEPVGGSTAASVPVLIFRLRQERYAVELKDLAEVLAFARCTPAPGAPAILRGVINVRGELRAVVDLGAALGLPPGGAADSGFVLMLRRSGREIGLKVDLVEETREIQPEEFSSAAQGSCVKGIASGTLMLLSVEAVLTKVSSLEES